MDYTTFTRRLTAAIDGAAADDPLVRAAIAHACSPWQTVADPAAQMRWGMFATSVQAVTDRLWPGQPPVAVDSPPAQPGEPVTAAATELVHAIAAILRAAGSAATGPDAWAYEAAAADLDAAVKELA